MRVSVHVQAERDGGWMCSLSHRREGHALSHRPTCVQGHPSPVLSFLLPSAAQPHVREPRGHPEGGAARIQIQHRRQDPVQLPGRLRPGGPRDAHLHRQPRERRRLGLPGPVLQRWVPGARGGSGAGLGSFPPMTEHSPAGPSQLIHSAPQSHVPLPKKPCVKSVTHVAMFPKPPGLPSSSFSDPLNLCTVCHLSRLHFLSFNTHLYVHSDVVVPLKNIYILPWPAWLSG